MPDDTRLERRREANKKWYSSHRQQELTKRAIVRSENRQAIADAQRAYVSANREKVNARGRVYAAANREQLRARDRAYNAANRDRRAAYMRAFRQANPEAYRDWATRNAETVWQRNQRRRARELEAFVENVNRSTVFQRDGGVCQICNLPIGGLKWHVDHVIPLIRGGLHCYANVQLTHARCNLSKGTRMT